VLRTLVDDGVGLSLSSTYALITPGGLGMLDNRIVANSYGVFLAGQVIHPNGSYGLLVARSNDDGASWTIIEQGLVGGANSLAVDDDGTVYACGSAGVVQYTPGGGSYSRAGVGTPDSASVAQNVTLAGGAVYVCGYRTESVPVTSGKKKGTKPVNCNFWIVWKGTFDPASGWGWEQVDRFQAYAPSGNSYATDAAATSDGTRLCVAGTGYGTTAVGHWIVRTPSP